VRFDEGLMSEYLIKHQLLLLFGNLSKHLSPFGKVNDVLNKE
jgi:hypothetical protein